MTRAEIATRRATIKKLYAEGVPAEELAERFGLNKRYIYSFAGNGHSNALTRNEYQVREMLQDGATYREVGQTFGVSKEVVAYFAKKNNLSRGSIKNNDEDVARKIIEKTNGQLEYVSGYTKKENPVKVRCVVCGGEFERTFHNLTTKGSVSCPYCTESKRNEIKQEQAIEKQRRKTERERKAQVNKEEKNRKSEAWKNRPFHKCSVCGTLTQNPKYCCADCRRKANYSTHEHKRRALILSQMVDKDISLEGLFRRDNGVCAICGKRCNYEDYVVRDGSFIAGDWYPSIDHIKPISKGGLHSWGNIQLAHRRCNRIKSDSE